MRRPALVLLAVASAVAGCSIGRTPGTTIAPHVIFLAPEGCGTAIAKVHRGDYALISPASGESYVPREGDVLEGPVREGQSVFRHYPGALRNDAWSEGLDVPLVVTATSLGLSDARRQLDAACVVPGADLPRTPGETR